MADMAEPERSRMLTRFRVNAAAMLIPMAVVVSTVVAALPPAWSQDAPQGGHSQRPEGPAAPTTVRHFAAWVVGTGDHAGAPFIIVDKKRATVYVYDIHARLLAQSPVLIGLAVGDDSVAGIGTRPMALISPAERTTPAGRFVAERGRNANGEDIVWVDYDAAISMHRVRHGHPAERRAERLATPSAKDNRISYGCINVPVVFYEASIRPIFEQRKAMVYVLPDTRPIEDVFGNTVRER